MSFVPPAPSQDDLKRYFPDTIEPPPDGVFELGLVLGGTVSAGAYTAGVLDFLFLALDSWRQAVAAGHPDAPRHQVRLKAVSGTSGGAVCAAIATVAAGLKFPFGASRDNPFYQLWVDTLDIKGMLRTDDLKSGQPLASLLNVAPIDQGAQAIIDYTPPRGETLARDWLHPDLALFLTVTNLRGVPYSTEYLTGRQYYYNHADFARFQVASAQPEPSPSFDRPDSFRFDLRITDPDRIKDQRGVLAAYAVASGAFPLGFTARAMERPTGHYAYRVLVKPGLHGTAKVAWHTPDWSAMADPSGALPPVWRFPAYDGGVINNEPVALVHSSLVGEIGTNERTGLDRRDNQDRRIPGTKRAILLIDPFADGAKLGPDSPARGLAAMVPALLSSMVTQARYDTADLRLAADRAVFSRFMITAQRDGKTGTRAIATGGLNGFMGFLCRDFRDHDYRLGWRNAWTYLTSELVLPENNALFGDWTEAQRRDRVVTRADKRYLPVIPLLGDAAPEPPEPVWPKGRLDPGTLRLSIRHRIAKVLDTVEDTLVPSDGTLDHTLTRLWLLPALTLVGPDKGADAIVGAIRDELKSWDLD